MMSNLPLFNGFQGNRRPYEMVEQGDGSPDRIGEYHHHHHHQQQSYQYHPFTLPSFSTKAISISSKRRKFIFIASIAFTLFIFIWQSSFFFFFFPSQPIPDVAFPLPGPIPNIVHFVRQMDRHLDGTPQPFHYEFRHFLAYYSAHLYLKPDSINLWSDATEEVLADAKINGDIYTKAVMSIPNLQFQSVTFPNQTTTGTPIKEYAHKSDFVRTRLMAQHGGQYFDDDAWVIKDLAVFRNTGFDNVFGLEWGQDICQATWMSTPNNTLMNAFAQLQEIVFDGDWLTASNNLITYLAKDIRGYGHDRHALLLEQNAWFPGQWDIGPDGLPMYYKVHDRGEGTEIPAPVSNLDDLVSNFGKGGDHKWRKDWRNTYVIHGFSNAIRHEHAQWVFEPYSGFTPEYILSQQSNIGRALYPALKDAIEKGYIQDPSAPIQVTPVMQSI